MLVEPLRTSSSGSWAQVSPVPGSGRWVHSQGLTPDPNLPWPICAGLLVQAGLLLVGREGVAPSAFRLWDGPWGVLWSLLGTKTSEDLDIWVYRLVFALGPLKY